MQADATVTPTCIDIVYILHVYLSLCVITIYCKCLGTNNYCLFSDNLALVFGLFDIAG